MRSTSPELPALGRRWISGRRGPRLRHDPSRPYACLREPEVTPAGRLEDVAVLFLTNPECSFRCLMCDLWKNTTRERLAPGVVAGQVAWGLRNVPDARHVKLYNAGSFFDARAIPPGDLPAIARHVADRETLIVECHPRLVGKRCFTFQRTLEPKLQVAMGLETIDPLVLPRLNKGMTLDDFRSATELLLEHQIMVRAFVLIRAPFQDEQAGLDWACASLEYAFALGVECCSLVPTRAGNGAMDWLQEHGYFEPPTLTTIERVLAHGLGLGRGRVLVDLWDLEAQVHSEEKVLARHGCARCVGPRVERLRRMNHGQKLLPVVACECGKSG